MKHNYIIDDIQYPPVTTILGLLDKSVPLMAWAVNNTIAYIKENQNNKDFDIEAARTEYKNVSKEARNIGSQTHDLIEQYIKHGKDKTEYNDYPDEVQNAFLAFLELVEKEKIEFVESECTIVSKVYGYAGTLDVIGKRNGIYGVYDFKTSKRAKNKLGIYDENIMQIANYLKARIECNNQTIHIRKEFDEKIFEYDYTFKEYDIQEAYIIRLDKFTGVPELVNCTPFVEKKFSSFIHLLNFYYADKKRRLKNNPFVKE